MLYKTIILVLLLLANNVLPAQHDTGQDRSDYDYQKFKTTYDKEISADTITQPQTILHPASSPGIFSNIPKPDSNVIYAIGISDPGMEKDLAVKLAIIRAKMIAAFMVLPEVGIMADNYSNEKQKNQSSEFATRYSDFFQLLSILQVDSNSFFVEALEFTSFEEAVVLVSYNKPDSVVKDFLFAEANVYQNERQKQVSFDKEGKFDMNCVEKHNDSLIASSSYALTSLNNTSEIQTVIDEDLFDFKYKNYRYVADSANNSTNPEYAAGVKLTYGLWKAFAEQFLTNVCQFSQNEAVEIKQVGDNYNSGNQSLSRELIKSQLTFQLSNVTIIDNRLSVHIDPLKLNLQP